MQPASCNILGERCTLDEALDEVVKSLERSKAPLYWGWSPLVTENQRRIVKLAQRFGGYLDWTTNRHQTNSILALQQGGQIGCTFGEIKNRAQLVVVWDLDLDSVAPLFCQRFIRTTNVVVVSTRGSVTTSYRSIQVDDRLAFVSSLRSVLASYESSNETAVARALDSDGSAGIPSMVDQVRELLWEIGKSAYTAWLIDSRIQDRVELEQLYKLISRMTGRGSSFFSALDDSESERAGPSSSNQIAPERAGHVRCIDLAADDNSIGAENALCWLTGFPVGVRVNQSGEFEYDPLRYGSEALLYATAIDLQMVIGDSVCRDAPEGPQMSNIPRIEIGACRSDPIDCLVQIPTCSDFIVGGTIFRGDGIPLLVPYSNVASRTMSQVLARLV